MSSRNQDLKLSTVALDNLFYGHNTPNSAPITSNTPSITSTSTSTSFTDFIVKRHDVEVGERLFSGEMLAVSGTSQEHRNLLNQIRGLNAAGWNIPNNGQPATLVSRQGRVGFVTILRGTDDITVYVLNRQEYMDVRSLRIIRVKDITYTGRLDILDDELTIVMNTNSNDDVNTFFVDVLGLIKSAGLKIQ